MNESQSSPRTVAALVVALVLGLFATIFLWPRIEDARAPQPRAAFVAVQLEGSDLAVVGLRDAPPGTSFKLHAVVEAEMPNGSVAFLTNAPRLEIGGKVVDPDSILAFDLKKPTKILWFTVEGSLPFQKLELDLENRAAEFGRFRFQEFLHPEWGLGASLSGSITSHYEERVSEQSEYLRDFGTQRFQVWIEVFATEDASVPQSRLKSPGPEDIEELSDSFPGVTLKAAGGLGAAQRVFGITQVEASSASPETLERFYALESKGLLFSRATVLRDLLTEERTSYEELSWKLIDLGKVSFSQGSGVSPGDLLRAGSRFVVLLEDAGKDGVLDLSDFCLDFEEGAAVRRLGDVFIGEGSVEWASFGAQP